MAQQTAILNPKTPETAIARQATFSKIYDLHEFVGKYVLRVCIIRDNVTECEYMSFDSVAFLGNLGQTRSWKLGHNCEIRGKMVCSLVLL